MRVYGFIIYIDRNVKILNLLFFQQLTNTTYHKKPAHFIHSN
ncbi:hypothetical protein M23134_01397 [Microscilla marina ATCC 23134]|uniref:Uncharacterized protein n=1 Tax=Microscilla marina ATCC 23134 TaxID=313606 RepID=A1ZJN9_MICM2|nr:hypothetical protein M23134_01397 [Microscilla marina ATCC 23134]